MRDETVREIRTEFLMIEQTLERISHLLDEIGSEDPSDHQMAAMGAYLANVYSGIENILKRLCLGLGIATPHGPNWHVNLLSLFGEKAGGPIPCLIDGALLAALHPYRAFRRLFFHGYAIVLRWDRLEPSARSVRSVFRGFRDKVESFLSGDSKGATA